MAYEAEPHRRIASLLDDAEYLPSLILDVEDRTEDFSRYLQGIAEEYQLRGVFTEFSHDKTYLRRKSGSFV